MLSELRSQTINIFKTRVTKPNYLSKKKIKAGNVSGMSITEDPNVYLVIVIHNRIGRFTVTVLRPRRWYVAGHVLMEQLRN